MGSRQAVRAKLIRSATEAGKEPANIGLEIAKKSDIMRAAPQDARAEAQAAKINCIHAEVARQAAHFSMYFSRGRRGRATGTLRQT